MTVASEDITFCANKSCKDLSCERNMKHIRLQIHHSVALFTDCPKWKDSGAKWLTSQLERRADNGSKST